MGSQQKKKKRTQDSRSLTGEIKRSQDLDVNKLALQPTFELGYSPLGVGTVSFVNVSTSLGPSQGGSGFPAQVTGLTVTPHAGSNTQLDLAWTAITAPDFNYYNVYRGTTTGFIVDSSSEIAQPVTNAYNNTGLIPGTTYYYRVSVTNDAELEGTPSSQVSGTTTGTVPILPDLLVHFDNDLVESINGLNFINSGTTLSGYTTLASFGTHAILINTVGSPPVDYVSRSSNGNPHIEIDTTTGFSVSLWVYPTDLSALFERRIIVEQYKDLNNKWTIQVDSTGKVFFFVKKAGTDYKREITGLIINQWQHIGAVFDGSVNTVKLYRNAVEGASSTATPQYPTDQGNPSINFSFRWNEAVTHYYKGRIDEFQYFVGKVLTPTQITNLMNTNSP